MKQNPEHWPTHRRKARGRRRRHVHATRLENRLRQDTQTPAAQQNWARP